MSFLKTGLPYLMPLVEVYDFVTRQTGLELDLAKPALIESAKILLAQPSPHLKTELVAAHMLVYGLPPGAPVTALWLRIQGFTDAAITQLAVALDHVRDPGDGTVYKKDIHASSLEILQISSLAHGVRHIESLLQKHRTAKPDEICQGREVRHILTDACAMYKRHFLFLTMTTEQKLEERYKTARDLLEKKAAFLRGQGPDPFAPGQKSLSFARSATPPSTPLPPGWPTTLLSAYALCAKLNRGDVKKAQPFAVATTDILVAADLKKSSWQLLAAHLIMYGAPRVKGVKLTQGFIMSNGFRHEDAARIAEELDRLRDPGLGLGYTKPVGVHAPYGHKVSTLAVAIQRLRELTEKHGSAQPPDSNSASTTQAEREIQNALDLHKANLLFTGSTGEEALEKMFEDARGLAQAKIAHLRGYGADPLAAQFGPAASPQFAAPDIPQISRRDAVDMIRNGGTRGPVLGASGMLRVRRSS